MRELEKRLWELQKRGYDQIGIIQVLNWIAEIKRAKKERREK